MIEETPFEFLRATPPDQIATFLRGEHPQTIALVIANLPTTDLAAKVMQLIPPAEQADIAMRIALMGQTSPDVVKEVARVMRQKLETVLQTSTRRRAACRRSRRSSTPPTAAPSATSSST